MSATAIRGGSRPPTISWPGSTGRRGGCEAGHRHRPPVAPGAGAAAQAFDQGRLSVGEADAISAAAALDPSAEDRLVERARPRHDLADVRERADKVKAAARHGEDPAVRRARLRALRRWREFDRDGMREVMGRFVPEEWARVAPVIDAYLEAQFQQARREGRREPIEAYRADAVLAALAAAGEAVGLTPAPKPTDDDTRRLRPSRPSPPRLRALRAESHEIETADGATESTDTEAGAAETATTRPSPPTSTRPRLRPSRPSPPTCPTRSMPPRSSSGCCRPGPIG